MAPSTTNQKSRGNLKMENNPFTNDELDILYNLIRDEHDVLMRGDWDAVKQDISALHLMMHKVLKIQKGGTI